ncbi:calcineurin-binding protein cabin-1-like [Uranotaenia lowii]|uniref:calcineurin-binding protein cabin-1-like n=1 Tax=Uranotaenia lowii TaxID=190385 RepID=UPI002479B6A1|nr:calcineurin-binding protein cabin-1-like [Uranotaenia lowii]
MLGKIAEKRKEEPIMYLTHYLKSSKYLYENNATYPIKINHSNPSHLSIEACELFYRINAAIIKYIENQESIRRPTGKYFKKILKELSSSPFAVNRAKINDVALKKKLNVQQNCDSELESPSTVPQSSVSVQSVKEVDNSLKSQEPLVQDEGKQLEPEVNQISRRESQESTIGTNTSSTSSNETNSSTSGTVTPNSEQEFSSDSESATSSDDEVDISNEERDCIFKDCIKNLEECVTRFPEHYKSIYRLSYHYMKAPGSTRSIDEARKLLLSSYKTTLGNYVAGLFTERRNNNFFNGIWRIPSSDIDRPGSFASHLSKCVDILLELLRQSNDHEMLLDLTIQLNRTPDTDKKYLNDCDRHRICRKAFDFCVQVFQTTLYKFSSENEDKGILSTMVDIFKAYRKSMKHFQEKESVFSNILVEAYRTYVANKAVIPENANLLDLAVKLCTYDINYRKAMDKISNTGKVIQTGSDSVTTIITPMQPISATFIPGLTKTRKSFNKPLESPSVPLIQNLTENEQLYKNPECDSNIISMMMNQGMPNREDRSQEVIDLSTDVENKPHTYPSLATDLTVRKPSSVSFVKNTHGSMDLDSDTVMATKNEGK